MQPIFTRQHIAAQYDPSPYIAHCNALLPTSTNLHHDTSKLLAPLRNTLCYLTARYHYSLIFFSFLGCNTH